MPKLQFHGAAGETTGSMHLLHLPGGPVALDCGLFQGKRAETRAKNAAFPIECDRIRSVLLSHAHMDHSGNVPGLIKRGFRGQIFATDATCDLCDVMLADSAKIQAEDARYWNEKRASRPEDRIEPLYSMEDAKACRQFYRPQAYGAGFELDDGCRATFLEAGHILGSACILVEIDRGRNKLRLLYTGDLGRSGMPILRDPVCPIPQVDYLISECTYANRHHANPTDMKEKLVWIINQTRQAGGKVVIPAFSVGRTQNVVYYLAQAMAEGMLERLPIFVDSPLSTSATEIFRKHPECYDGEAGGLWLHNGDVFGADLVTYITDVEQSKGLNFFDEPCVIIASSGMCEAGRILHHLKNNVENEANTVVIVGFQAQHTLGRRIVERREEIKIYGRMYKLLCRVEVLNGFSAHADADDLARCLSPIAGSLKAAFVVHGDEQQRNALRVILQDAGCDGIHLPNPGDVFEM